MICFILAGVVGATVNKLTEGPRLFSGKGANLRVLLIAAGVITGLVAHPLLAKKGLFVIPETVDPGWLILVLLILLWLYSRLAIDINLTAVLGSYRDQLSEAFLVGVDRDRQKFKDQKPVDIDLDKINVNEVQIETDLDLHNMCVNKDGGPDEAIVPYQIVNTALNLQGSKHADVRERNADFFMFSNKYCGGSRTGYCSSELLETVYPQIDLATAMAVSAAAASPNMGKGTNWALVMVMTLFNIRLGYWVPNPGHLREWAEKEKKRTGRPLKQTIPVRRRWRIKPIGWIREMRGKLDETWDWVNLSDGGHLENMAAYELLRRRCKFIIIGDAEADPRGGRRVGAQRKARGRGRRGCDTVLRGGDRSCARLHLRHDRPPRL